MQKQFELMSVRVIGGTYEYRDYTLFSNIDICASKSSLRKYSHEVFFTWLTTELQVMCTVVRQTLRKSSIVVYRKTPTIRPPNISTFVP